MYETAKVMAGFELLTVDHNKGVNMEYALSQDNLLIVFRADDKGMAYLYEFDMETLNMNTKTEIYIKLYNQDMSSYEWWQIGTTYLESCNSTVIYNDDYFNR